MPNPYFRFKQFTIRHDRSAMKVGTDGVLLGAWASPYIGSEPLRVLDVGTGTGLIALMLAQRFPMAVIEGIDIDDASIEQAKENVRMSPFNGRVNIEKKDFKGISNFSKQYDLIVSNPPFYVEETLGGNEARDSARHTVSLPFEILIENAAKLMHSQSAFCVILPYTSASDFIAICAQNRLYLTHRLDIKPTPQKTSNRALLSFSPSLDIIQGTPSSTLTLYDSLNQRTPEYADLTKDFYL